MHTNTMKKNDGVDLETWTYGNAVLLESSDEISRKEEVKYKKEIKENKG